MIRLSGALCLLALAASASVRAQAPLTLVDTETEVRRVRFEVEGSDALEPAELPNQVATTGPPPGLVARLTRALPFTERGVYPFVPVELARDVVRLERYFARNGFPRAAADYAVRLDTARNAVDVTFRVVEGPPLLVEAISFGGPGRRTVFDVLAPELHDAWGRFERAATLQPGQRLDEASLLGLQGEAVGWLRGRGYAFADAGVERFVDSTGLAADVRLKVTPGPRARFGQIAVEGAEGLAERVVLRELPFRPGDRFDGRQLNEGQREIFGLGLFQLAIVEVAPGQRRDTTVDVRVRLRRGPSRTLSGFGGYFSDGGVTLRGRALHRNSLGAAQPLALDVEARTGIGGIDGRSITRGPIRDYRASLSLRQPYVFNRRVSATLRPSVRDRSDEFEESLSAELSGTLLYTHNPIRTAALTAAGRYQDLSRGQGLQLYDPEDLVDTGVLRAATGGLSYDGTWGLLDNTLQPRRGFVLRPALLAATGDVTVARARLAATGLMPVSERLGLAARLSVGALTTARGTDIDVPRDYVALREQLFYAGGTTDVRGWGTNRLGPKSISIRFDEDSPDELRLRSTRDVNYIGTGGRAKVSGSVQINLPLPLGPQWGANTFLDGGRVWGPSTLQTETLLRATGNAADAVLANLLDDENAFRFGSGAGVQYLTPVGFVSFTVGVKLNPSYLDLRPAARVYCGDDVGTVDGELQCAGGYLNARKLGLPFDPESVTPPKTFFGLIPQGQRVQFHIAIGQSF